MYKGIFCILLLATACSGIACDYNLLNSEVESYNDDIWSRTERMSTDSIKDSLSFLDDEKSIDSKYASKENFDALSNEIKTGIKHSRFLEFFKNCETIYSQSHNSAEKAAIFILLDGVKEKFTKDNNMLAQIRDFKRNGSHQ